MVLEGSVTRSGRASLQVMFNGSSIPSVRARRLPQLALVAGLALGAAARAATPVAACCNDPARFHYDPLPVEGTVGVDIGPGAPMFEFQTGRSAFHAFLLPAATRPYLIELRSFLETSPGNEGGRVFYPILTLLNDDYVVARSTELDALRFELPLLEAATAPAYRLTIGVDPTHGRQRYLVVYTPAQLIAPRRLPPVATPAAAAELAQGAYLGAAAYGRLSITLRPADDVEPAGAVTRPATEPDSR